MNLEPVGEPQPDLYDVVVAGYGPTGLATASLLARTGHSVCVFERWPSLYGQPRMATIDAESARIVQSAGDVERAFRNSLPRTRYVLANGDGRVLVDNDWSGRHQCGFPVRISLHQPDIEDAMHEAALARGAEVNQGFEVTALEQDEETVTVTARPRAADGESVPQGHGERRVRARYLVAADGARSTVRGLVGIERDAWPFRSAWYSVDARRIGPLPDFFGLSPDGEVAVIFGAPGGRSHSFIPLGTNHLRFNFEVDPDGDHADKLDHDTAYRYLREVYGVTPAQAEVYREAIYPFEGRLARRWRSGRVFLAGDAAHVMTPFLGQGGCSALRDAANIAWKLDLVLRGAADPALLDSYEAERMPHAAHYVDASDRLAALVLEPDPQRAAERDRSFTSGGAPAAPVEPPLAAGVLHAPDPLAGTLAPQGKVRWEGREGLFDDVAGWGFQLIGDRFDPASGLSAGDLAFLEGIGCIVAGVAGDASEEDGLVRDTDDIYGAYFREHGVAAVLMRPDFVVFGTATDADGIAALVDDLRRQLRPA